MSLTHPYGTCGICGNKRTYSRFINDCYCKKCDQAWYKFQYKKQEQLIKQKKIKQMELEKKIKEKEEIEKRKQEKIIKDNAPIFIIAYKIFQGINSRSKPLMQTHTKPKFSLSDYDHDNKDDY
jgi:hypothetical protein